MHSKVPASGTVIQSLSFKKCRGKAACVRKSECAHTRIPNILIYLSNVPVYLSNMPIYMSNMPIPLSNMYVVTGAGGGDSTEG